MTFIVNVFLELPAPKNVTRSMSKQLCFTGPSNGQHGKCAETLSQSERQQFYNIHSSP